jgi:sulfur relay (sulfurtransferase) complex TusBCD TusD component (DsrE family)
MRLTTHAFLAFFVAAIIGASASFAGETDPLFVNTTTDDAHRARMALVFSKSQLERKHPVTVFLNDKAVLIAAKSNSDKFKEHQDLLLGLMNSGANVLICAMCMKHYGVNEADILPGIKIGNPELTGDLLFQDNTKTLTW